MIGPDDDCLGQLIASSLDAKGHVLVHCASRPGLWCGTLHLGAFFSSFSFPLSFPVSPLTLSYRSFAFCDKFTVVVQSVTVQTSLNAASWWNFWQEK